jgi:hypothetical protein
MPRLRWPTNLMRLALQPAVSLACWPVFQLCVHCLCPGLLFLDQGSHLLHLVFFSSSEFFIHTGHHLLELMPSPFRCYLLQCLRLQLVIEHTQLVSTYLYAHHSMYSEGDTFQIFRTWPCIKQCLKVWLQGMYLRTLMKS